jgi:hypothetical protein
MKNETNFIEYSGNIKYNFKPNFKTIWRQLKKLWVVCRLVFVLTFPVIFSGNNNTIYQPGAIQINQTATPSIKKSPEHKVIKNQKNKPRARNCR